eukprot:CAMPEP_0184872158 /NCGR_PEP_ID=MMETSP0580-20130426/41127_1 /TAXON_ID=1118495 /ORGANISM="Dactyliosolen fragilissimus" /LENGTH=499 /DNA_ID=CAMNT_0027374909 /DNA_START=178 /DNA_END=1677 /DNA_ORIENTATION=-
MHYYSSFVRLFIKLSLLLLFGGVHAHNVCVDNPFKFKLFNKKKKCSQFNPSKKLCRKNNTVKKNCPKTCGLCEELCLDHVEIANEICLYVSQQNKKLCFEDNAFQALCPQECMIAWTQLGSDIDGEAVNNWSGSSVSLSADGLTVAIGAYGNDGNGSYSGHVRIYKFESNEWPQLGSDIDGEAGDISGSSVSLSSDGLIVAIGAYGNDVNGYYSGHVRLYKYGLEDWYQLGGDIDGEAADDWSGYSVSLSSDGMIVAVGAPRNDDNGYDSGHVRIYKYVSNSWSQLGSDINGEAARDLSGSSVSLSADGLIVAIGAYYNDGNGNNSGHVRVHKYESNEWSQLGSDIDGEAAIDWSGWSVSISADGLTLAIGALNGGIGHVGIYRYEFNHWSLIGNNIDGEAAGDWSGYSVSISANGLTVAIGARGNDDNGNNSGHVRVYKYESNDWSQLGDDIDGEAAEDESGSSVSLSADGLTLAIGAPRNDGNGNTSGHVRVYSLLD